MKIINLEAKRAKYAFDAAEQGNKKQQANAKFNYSAAVQELPAMIRMNGLRATMAFYYSKDGHHKAVFENICDWFASESEPTKFMREKMNGKSKAEDFMNVYLTLTDDQYRIVQAEVLTLANWMIRFVKTENSNAEKNGES